MATPGTETKERNPVVTLGRKKWCLGLWDRMIFAERGRVGKKQESFLEKEQGVDPTNLSETTGGGEF